MTIQIALGDGKRARRKGRRWFDARRPLIEVVDPIKLITSLRRPNEAEDFLPFEAEPEAMIFLNALGIWIPTTEEPDDD